MIIEHNGLCDVSGSLIILDGVKNAGNEEMVRIRLNNNEERMGRVVELDGDRAVVQVFEGTKGISLKNTSTVFLGHPMELKLSDEMLGRIFSGAGKPIDGLGPIYSECSRDINGSSINPVSRVYPRNYISTGISSIDALSTLIRGQRLPVTKTLNLPWFLPQWALRTMLLITLNTALRRPVYLKGS